MIKPTTHMPCPVCQGEVKGRSDKRYCSVKCKNRHHRIAFMLNKPMVEEQNRRLLRNLTLLEGIMSAGKNAMNIHKSTLIRRGFDMGSCTGTIDEGDFTIYNCYHFSYWVTKDGIIHVVRNGEVSDYMPGFYERYEIDYPQGVRFDRRFRRELERKNSRKFKKVIFRPKKE